MNQIPFQKFLKAIFIIIFLLLITVSLLSFSGLPGGSKLLSVISGSMEPALPVGSLILVGPSAEYNIGDIIAFKKSDDAMPITHRIYDLKQSDNTVLIYTKGDANEIQDMDPITSDNITGKVIMAVPIIGRIVNFTKSSVGFFLMIFLPALAVIANEIISIKKETQHLKNNEDKYVMPITIVLLCSLISTIGLVRAIITNLEEIAGNTIQTGIWHRAPSDINYQHQTVDIISPTTDNI